MINRWERGRAEIDQFIQQGRLTRVAANHDLAESHLALADTHLIAAATLRELDPGGATGQGDATILTGGWKCPPSPERGSKCYGPTISVRWKVTPAAPFLAGVQRI